MRKEAPWILGTVFTSFFLTGLIFDFNYFDKVEVQLHDAYIIVTPIYFAFESWIALTFITFFILALRNGFQHSSTIIILLITNTILLVWLFIITYAIYAFYSSDAVEDLSNLQSGTNLYSGQLLGKIVIYSIWIVAFAVGQYLLIRRLIELRKHPGVY